MARPVGIAAPRLPLSRIPSSSGSIGNGIYSFILDGVFVAGGQDDGLHVVGERVVGRRQIVHGKISRACGKGTATCFERLFRS
jgi:hypothetical protein